MALDQPIEGAEMARQSGRSRYGVQARRVRRLLGLILVGLAAAWWSYPASAAVGAGSVLAWGHNDLGQLGDGSMVDSPVPAAVSAGAIPAGIPVTQIAAGANHSLALTSTGQAYAWGSNNAGQLGDPTALDSTSPVAVSAGAIPVGTTFTQIAAGDNDSLALSSTGQLYAWGSNGEGQLGDDTRVGSPAPVAVLSGALPLGATITQIAAGAFDSLALTASGQVYAWGSNSGGALGNGMTTESLVPVAVSPGAIPAGTRITEIAAGADHNLALSATGQLYAWGSNSGGQLGDGTTTESLVPVAVSAGAIPVGTRFTEIAVGAFSSLALSATGQLYAWGSNDDGELGNGTTADSLVPVEVATGVIPAGIGLTQIAAGADYSLALSATGQIYAWGANDGGQLGNGTTTNLTVPAAGAPLAGTTLDALARGSSALHSMAIVGDLAVTTSSLSAGTVGSPYSATLLGAGGAMPYRWSAAGLPPGISIDAASGTVSGTPTVDSTYNVAVALTDANGLTTARDITLRIAPTPIRCLAAPTGTGENCQPPSAPTRRTPLTLTHIAQSHRTWREPGSHNHKGPLGTTFSFTVNEAATVSFVFTQRLSGRSIKRTCVAVTSKNRRWPKCTLTAGRGRLSLAARAGRTNVSFLGRITNSPHLKPGTYTVTITATKPTTRQRSRPQTRNFTIIA